jgi:hypothetical protein
MKKLLLIGLMGFGITGCAALGQPKDLCQYGWMGCPIG